MRRHLLPTPSKSHRHHSSFRRPLIIASLGLLLVAAPLIYLYQKQHGQAEAAWYDESYGYRKAISITNSSGSTQTNFVTQFTLDTSTPISTGKLLASCADLRVIDSSGKNLPFFVSNCNSASTNIWTKVTSIPTSGATIYVYYGNPQATSQNNATATFDLVPDTPTSGTSAYSSLVTTPSVTTSSAENGVTPLVGSSMIKFTGTNDGTAGNHYAYYKLVTPGGDYLKDYVIQAGDYLTFFVYNQAGPGSSAEIDFTDGGILRGSHPDQNSIDIQGPNARSNGSWYWRYIDLSDKVGKTINRVDVQQEDNTPNSSWVAYYTNIRIHTYNKNLSTSLASEEKSPAPVAYWKFDDGSGTVAKDSTTNANNGNLSGATWQSEDQCVIGKCLYFGGDGDRVTIPDPGSNWILDITGDLTLSAWIRTNQMARTEIIYKNYNNEYDFALYEGNGFLFWHGDGAWEGGSIGTAALKTNKWHHVVARRTMADRLVKFYIDGNYVGQWNFAKSSLTPSASDIMIGTRNGGQNFQGYIDEVKIYNYARSAQQIKAEYSSGIAHQTSNEGVAAALGSNNKNPNSVSNGLVGYWKMEESSGPSLDSSGNNNTGTWSNTPTPVGGKFGSGLSFAGNNDYFDTSANSSLEPSNITVAAYVYNTGQASNNGFLAHYNGNPSNAWSYQIGINTSNQLWVIFQNGSTNTVNLTSSTSIPTNTWSHVAFTFDHQNVYMYINGIKDANSVAYSGNITYAGSPQWTRIGRGDNEYNDRLDEVRIYNRALTSSEVQQLFNWASGPVGYWKIDEGSSNNLQDSSGNGNNGTIAGFNWSTGKYGNSINSTSTTDRVTISHSGSLNFSSAITFSTWINPTVLGGNQNLLTKSGASWNGIEAILWSNLGNMDVRARLGDCVNGAVDHFFDTGGINLNSWTHLAFTYDANGGTNNARLYKNGKLVSQTTLSGNLCSNTSNLYFNSGGEHFYGKIDDFKLYNYARTQKQIVEDMNAGHPAGGSPVGSQLIYYKLDEGSSNSSSNSGNGGSSFNASLYNTTWTNNGKFNKALSFNGSNGYAAITGVTQIDNSSFTISGWMNITSQPQYYSSMLMSSSSGFVLYFNQNTRQPWAQVYNGTGWFQAGCSSNALNLSEWGYLALVYDEPTTTLKTYFNGKLCSSPVTVTGGMNNAYTTTLNIGTYAGNYHDGRIDEIKLYNYALTDDEIKLDYNHGSALKLGSLSTEVSGTNTNSSGRSYCPPGDTGSCNPPTGEWQLNEFTGTTVADTSGNGNTGTLVSSPKWITGKTGSALDFNGSGKKLTLATPLGYSGYTTVSVWYKRSEASSSNTWRTILGHASANIHPLILHDPSRNLGIWDGSWRDFGYTVPDDGKWHHFEVVYNSGVNATLYVDGVYKNQIATTLNLSTNPIGTIGNWNSNNYWSGNIDDIKIYNYARTPAQITWDYNRGAPLAHWKLDDCQGNKANDSSGNGNFATIVAGGGGSVSSLGTCNTAGTAWGNGQSGKYNSSISLDGVDDNATAPITTTNGLNIYGSVTFAAWFKRANTGTYQTIVADITNCSNPLDGFIVRFSDANTLLFQGYKADIGNSNVFNASYVNAALFNDTTNWHHVISTWDGTTNSNGVKMYIDGKLVAQGTSTATNFNSLSGINQMIGSLNCNAHYFAGQIDDVRIYNYDLTASQAKILYNAGASTRFAPDTGTP